MAIIILTIFTIVSMIGFYSVSAIAFKALIFVVMATVLLFCFMYNKPACLVLFFGVIVFQNISISSATIFIETKGDFQAFQGLNFLLIFFMSLLCFLDFLLTWRRVGGRELRTFLIQVSLIGLLVAGYVFLGLANAPVSSVAIYFRYTVTGLCMILCGLYFGTRFTMPQVANAFMGVFLLVFVLTTLEIAFPKTYYTLTGVPEYLSFKEGYEIDWRSTYNASWKRFLNLPLDIDLRSKRFFATVVHHVSSAYLFSFTALCCIALKRYYSATFLFALVFWNGSKGPIALLFLSIAFLVFSKISHRYLFRFMVLTGVLYLGFTFTVGFLTSDQHVIGFLGGVYGALDSPLGHGIGVGGNLSAMSAADDFLILDEWRSTGVAAYAVESAVGALIYQMGVASFLILLFYFNKVHKAIDSPEKVAYAGSSIVFAFSSFVVVLNAVFQEEGFSPYAAGLNFFFLGVVLANQMFRESGKMAVSPSMPRES